MPPDKQFYDGQIVFDRKRTDPSDDMLLVVDSDVGELHELDGETYRLVKHNDENKALNGHAPVADSVRVIRCVYLKTDDGEDPALGDRTYTFPEFRLSTVRAGDDTPTNGFQPYQWALSSFFAELAETLKDEDQTIESVQDLQVLAMKADVDGEVILRGTDLALGRTDKVDPEHR